MKTLFLFLITFTYQTYANNEVNWVKAGLSWPLMYEEVYTYNDKIVFEYFDRAIIICKNDGDLYKDFWNNSLVSSKILKDSLLFTVNEEYLATYNLNNKEVLSLDTVKLNNKQLYISKANIDLDNDRIIFLAESSEKYIVFWDYSKKEINSYIITNNNTVDFALLDNNKFIAMNKSDDYSTLKLYDIIDNELVYQKDIYHSYHDFGFKLNSNSDKLFVYDDNVIKIFETGNMDLEKTLYKLRNSNMHLNMNKPVLKENGNIIAYTAPDSSLVIYDAIEDEVLHKANINYFCSGAYFIDDNYIVTTDALTGRSDLYNYISGKIEKSLIVNSGYTKAVQIDTDNNHIIYANFSLMDQHGYLSAINFDSKIVINSIKIPFGFGVEGNTSWVMEESNISSSVLFFIDSSLYGFYNLLLWDYSNNEYLVFMFDKEISDVDFNPINDDFIVTTKEGEIHFYDNDNKIYKTIEHSENIISAMFNEDGQDIYIFSRNQNNNELSFFKYSIIDNYFHEFENIDFPILQNDNNLRKFFRRYFCSNQSCIDVKTTENIELSIIHSDIYHMDISEDLNYVMYSFRDYIDIYDINSLKLAYKYSTWSLYFNYYILGSKYNDLIMHTSASKILNKNDILSFSDEAIFCFDLQDTLKTSYREVSQNGEALISEFYNYDDVLTIEVNPDINRQIKYQITDISGNTIQKGTLPQGTSHEQINFFGHPKSSYFIMFHTETSKQIFKFIN